MWHYVTTCLCAFLNNMNGPGVVPTCVTVQEFVEVYHARPFDFDGDGDCDLEDFAAFQNCYDGEICGRWFWLDHVCEA